MREAPDCVRRALALINERASLALRTDIPFNEVLSAAYMERQKMSVSITQSDMIANLLLSYAQFHSDSEKGLGPIVASLSLGSAALMHFRPHVNMENPKAKSTHALSLVLRHVSVNNRLCVIPISQLYAALSGGCLGYGRQWSAEVL